MNVIHVDLRTFIYVLIFFKDDHKLAEAMIHRQQIIDQSYMQGSHAHILTVGVQVRDPEGVKKTLGNFATEDQLQFFVDEMNELHDVVDVITTSLCAPLAPDCE